MRPPLSSCNFSATSAMVFGASASRLGAHSGRGMPTLQARESDDHPTSAPALTPHRSQPTQTPHRHRRPIMTSWLGRSRRVVYVCLAPGSRSSSSSSTTTTLGTSSIITRRFPVTAAASAVVPRVLDSRRCSSSSVLGTSTFRQIGNGLVTPSSSRRMFSALPSHQVVGMPSLSPTMEAGTIASWAIKEGDSFGPGDVLCEVETDKAVVSFDAQDEGVLAKILMQAGSGEVKVGQPIMIIVDDASDVAAFANYTPDAAPAAAAPAKAAASAAPAAPAAASSPPSPPPPPPPSSSSSPLPPASAAAGVSLLGHPGRVFASPLAKTLAEQMGHDLRTIPGTGPNGRVVAADVREFVPSVVSQQAAVTAPAPAPSAAAAGAPAHVVPVAAPIPGMGFTDYPLSEASRAVAARLTAAKQTVPHYYLTVDLQLGKLLALRETLNKELGGEKGSDASLSVNDFLLKAAALASKKVPEANASWHGDFVRQYHGVDINLMVGVGDGLLAPVIRNVDTKGLRALSAEVAGLVAGAEGGGLSSEALQSGTFTLVNVGMYGVKSVAPIVSLPQACVLGVGAIENRVVPAVAPEEGGEVYQVVPGVTVTLSCDHRVIDGAVGAQWLSAFKSLVEDPVTLLL